LYAHVVARTATITARLDIKTRSLELEKAITIDRRTITIADLSTNVSLRFTNVVKRMAAAPMSSVTTIAVEREIADWLLKRWPVATANRLFSTASPNNPAKHFTNRSARK
jgi:hypothetical protein